MRVISRQRFFLQKSSAAFLTHAFVISRLDFCASLLCGISIKLLKRLQKILHYSIRVVEKFKRADSISLPLRERRWLQIHRCIQSRLAMLSFSSLLHAQPRALAESLVSLQSSQRAGASTRTSSDASIRLIPRTKTKKGDNAVRVAAPKFWNSLPSTVRHAGSTASFRELLLTHLWTLESAP